MPQRYEHLYPIVQKYIGIPFCKENGPQSHSGGEIPHRGLNCQLLAHRLIKELFHISLPPTLLSRELLLENSYFSPLESLNEIVIGDIILFGRSKISDIRNLHMAVCVASGKESDIPNLIHSTRIEGQVCIWPLDKFGHYAKYGRVYGVRRLALPNK